MHVPARNNAVSFQALWGRPGLVLSIIVHGLILAVPGPVEFRYRGGEERDVFIQIETIAEEPAQANRTPDVEAVASSPAANLDVRPAGRTVEPAPSVSEESGVDMTTLSRDQAPPRAPVMEKTPRGESPAPPTERAGLSPKPVTEKTAAASRQPTVPTESVAPRAAESSAVPLVVETEFGREEAPRFSRRELATYPPFARRRGKEGTVLLRLSIDEDGALSDVEILEDPGFGFAEAAVAAVRKSSFEAATRRGRKVSSRALLPVRFELR